MPSLTRRRLIASLGATPLALSGTTVHAGYNKDVCSFQSSHLGWQLHASVASMFSDAGDFLGHRNRIRVRHADSQLEFILYGYSTQALLDVRGGRDIATPSVPIAPFLPLFKPSHQTNGPQPIRTFLMVTDMNDADRFQHVTELYTPRECVEDLSAYIICDEEDDITLSETDPSTTGFNHETLTPLDQRERVVAILTRSARVKLELGYHAPANDSWPRLKTYEIATEGLNDAIQSIHNAVLDRAEQHPPETCKPDPQSCFLTTACCAFMGRPDECIELQTLRAFRDGWLARRPDGAALIGDYYRIAPRLCRAIAGNTTELRRLYWGTILPCVAAIHLGAHGLAFRLYRRMIHRLSAKYAQYPITA